MQTMALELLFFLSWVQFNLSSTAVFSCTLYSTHPHTCQLDVCCATSQVIREAVESS